MTHVRLHVVAAFRSELPPRLGRRADVVMTPAGAAATRLGVALSAWRDAPETPVIVTGSCGELRDALAPGTLVLPGAVVAVDGSLHRPDEALRDRIMEAARQAGVAVVDGGRLVEAAGVADHAALRADLRERGDLVDMESATLAAVARAHGRAWAVLRFVTDTPSRPLGFVREVYGGWPEEDPGLAATLLGLSRRPWHAVAMARLGRTVAVGRGRVGRVLARYLERAGSRPSDPGAAARMP